MFMFGMVGGIIIIPLFPGIGGGGMKNGWFVAFPGAATGASRPCGRGGRGGGTSPGMGGI